MIYVFTSKFNHKPQLQDLGNLTYSKEDKYKENHTKAYHTKTSENQIEKKILSNQRKSYIVNVKPMMRI